MNPPRSLAEYIAALESLGMIATATALRSRERDL